jgi:hypothetical protein
MDWIRLKQIIGFTIASGRISPHYGDATNDRTLVAVQEQMWAEKNAKLDAFRDKLDADMAKTDAETKSIKARMKAIHAPRNPFQTS